MTYTARSRDRYKAVAATTTGIIVFGATAATGVSAGLAARATAVENAPVAESAIVQPQHVKPVKRERPERTVIHTRIITRTTAPGTAQPATGSTVSASNQPAASTPQAPANPPAQPAPQPAPSSGS
jgi:hypothetical protein